LNLFICVAEPASLDGSTRGVGPRIKEQNDRFATQIFQRYVGAVLVRQSEVGSLIIDLHAYFSAKLEVAREQGSEPRFLPEDFTLPDFDACGDGRCTIRRA